MPNGQLWPQVSIVTPSYNQAPFIEETIRAVLLQKYPNLEYIVMDGGSTDGSVDIIRKYEPWLSYWVSEPDGGQADAINNGFARATGEIIAWLNSDDYYAPDTLHQVARKFISDPALGLAYGDIDVVDGNGNKTGSIGYHASGAQMLAELEMPYQPASFFSRAVLKKAGRLDPSLRYVMDVDILLKVMANAGFAHIPARLAAFRIHAESKTFLAECQFAEELLTVLQRVLEHPDRYPGLAAIGWNRIQSSFYRRISKHLYLGNRFDKSLRYILLACQTHPSSTLTVLGDAGLGWLVRRFLPIGQYRALAHWLRSNRRST